MLIVMTFILLSAVQHSKKRHRLLTQHVFKYNTTAFCTVFSMKIYWSFFWKQISKMSFTSLVMVYWSAFFFFLIDHAPTAVKQLCALYLYYVMPICLVTLALLIQVYSRCHRGAAQVSLDEIRCVRVCLGGGVLLHRVESVPLQQCL